MRAEEPATEGSWRTKTRLVVLSFLMLFVELALIRWTGSNVIYLSYFSNFVLLGSFLGIGVGFLRGGSRTNLFPWAAPALAMLVGFVLAFPVTIDRSGANLIFFGELERTGLPIWVTLPVIFIAVAGVMSMIAQEVARTFVRFRPLEAYRLDILGSLAGIAAFSVLSFLGAPPAAWGLVAGATLLALYRPQIKPVQVVSVALLIGMLSIEMLKGSPSWSPYYKITYVPVERDSHGVLLHDAYQVSVNGIPHQVIMATAERRTITPIYFRPYQRTKDIPLNDVLIVGAGTGSDTAIALAQGAKHVDALEIDPRIYRLGAQLHPDHPYQDPRVSVHVEDGRAFLHDTDRRYDLILFALPDSLTLVSGQSSLRLESYLFTREAMEEARAHLRPGGAFAMYNYYRGRWLVDRLAHTLQLVYGRAPCFDQFGRVGHLALLTIGLQPATVRCSDRWAPAANSDASALDPATDDHPFVYLRQRSVPSVYLLAIALILIGSVLLIRGASGPMLRMRGYVDLFFMGAAFLLLETKNVVQFALLFGTTWFVNALVFGGILLCVLAAVEVARHVRFRRPALLYPALLVTLVIAWVVPQDTLLSLSAIPRFVAAVALAFAPIFLANLVFAERFRQVASSTIAFGANLLGAMIGGLLEYTSLITGYRALLVVAAVLYGAAFLTGRRLLRREELSVVPQQRRVSTVAGR
jgi:SAM-dependent methyltransferase